MKVTLICPPSPFLVDQKAFPPLGILYLAAFLGSHGIDVEVADLSNREQELEDALESYLHSDLYGITATTPQYPLALKILKILRRKSPRSSIIVGGAHPSSLPEKCLQDGFDMVVKGEGEQALLQIARSYLKEKHVKGIVSAPVVRDIDTLPFPARHLIDLHAYAYDIDGSAGTTLFTSRGCPYSCAFCSKDVWPKSVRYHSVQYVIKELNHVMTQYGFKHFLFLDDSLSFKKSRML